MKKVLILGLFTALVGPAWADLGIMDTVSETQAKTNASSLGVTQIYDHPNDVANGQFIVPVQYNRTAAEGNGAEHDPNASKPNDIDYIPLSQLKGTNGINGSNGVNGAVGSQGDTGVAGKDGQNGKDGLNGKDGRDADDMNNRLTVNVGAEVRWYDWKHFALGSGYRYDAWHGGHTVDALVFQIKLGKSYEERTALAQDARIKALEAAISRLQAQSL